MNWYADSSGQTVPVIAGGTTEIDRGADATRWFVEQFALLLCEAGMPRIAARVLAFVLVHDTDHFSAGELADGIQVSPAAISGAVRHLARSGLISRGRDPGLRHDTYWLKDGDTWPVLMLPYESVNKRVHDLIAKSEPLLEHSRLGSQRAREALEYYQFLRQELPKLNQRWRQRTDNGSIHRSMTLGG